MNIFKYSIFLVFFFFSCKKKETPDPLPTKGSVYLKFNHTYNGQSFELNKEFTDGFGNKISFTRVDYYISNPILKNTTGTNLSINNNYFLVNSSTETALVASLEPTTIKEIAFNIGLDEETNHKDPANYESTHPLAYQSPSMHWGWSTYYLFIVIEGNVDTDGDGSFDDIFAFHIGTDNYLKSISTNSNNISIEAGKSNMIPIKIDYSKLFLNIDLSTDNITHTMDNMPLANTFANNISTAFSFE